MGRSKIRNEHFRSAAARLYPNVEPVEWGAVDRLAEGGAYVEMMVFVSEDEAAKDEKKAQEEAAAEAARKAEALE